MLELEDTSVLYLLPKKGFSDHELNLSLRVLQNKGVEVTLASLTKEALITDQNNHIIPDNDMRELEAENYDALVILGSGEIGEEYRKEVKRLAKDFNDQCKVVAGISLAVELMNESGILEGKRVAAHPAIVSSLKEDCEIVDRKTAIDDRIVTGRAGEDAEIFGERIAEAILGIPE